MRTNDRFRNAGVVTPSDVAQMQRELRNDDWIMELFDFWMNEPALAVSVGRRLNAITDLLAGAKLSNRVRRELLRQLPLLVWPALLLMHRAHNREHDGEIYDDPDPDGPELAVDERFDSVTASLHIGFFESEFPDLDEPKLQALLKKHSTAIGHEMLEAGVAAARRLFNQETP
jgi:hypothetical protein